MYHGGVDRVKIAIIGTGYVGLVTGACLAAKGHQVTCIDKKQEIVDKINRMQMPIYEPGLEDLLKTVVASGNLAVTTGLRNAVLASQVSIVAVGTPFGDGKIDLRYIETAAKEIGTVLREKDEYHVVCIKSTVVPSTTDTLVKENLIAASGKEPGEFGLAMNPEFLREGKAVEDFMDPDRIVIGAYDDKSFAGMKKVYAGLFDAPIIQVNLRTAEMIKYAANALLATLISYSNEVASICEAAGGIDVKEVLEAVTLDRRFNPRIGNEPADAEIKKYLQAGCGFGGSCFPKDVKALIAFSAEKGYLPRIIKSTLRVNQEQPLALLRRLEEKMATLENKKIAVLGLAFKPGTDDVRESPSIAIITELLKKKARVWGVDPFATKKMGAIIPQKGLHVVYTKDPIAALEDADAAILVTSWPDFLKIPAKEYSELMNTPLVVDGRRVLDRGSLEKAGCSYLGVGLA
jgi:UDPglucose 6-dehydrogenase